MVLRGHRPRDSGDARQASQVDKPMRERVGDVVYPFSGDSVEGQPILSDGGGVG